MAARLHNTCTVIVQPRICLQWSHVVVYEELPYVVIDRQLSDGALAPHPFIKIWIEPTSMMYD